MSDAGLARRRSFRRPLRAAVTALNTLVCLLALFAGPAPVLCLESEGACAAAPSAGSETAGCHDPASQSLPSCGSCTDIAAPEESLVRGDAPGGSCKLAAVAGLPASAVRGPSPGAVAHAGPTASAAAASPLFLRSVFLLI